MSQSATVRVPRFGFIFDFSAPERWTGSAASWWPRLMDLAGEVDALGFDTIWTAEHHFTPDSFSASPLLMLARMAASTSRARLGTYVLLMPFHNPIRVAEECAAIDILTGGRLELGLGIGFRQEEFDGFHVDRRGRAQNLEDGIDTLRRSWSDAAPSPGEFEVTPRGVQPGGPPLWLAARGEVPARRAGRMGTNLHLLGGRSILRTYTDSLRAAGHDPADHRVSVFKPIFVADDPARELERHRDEFAYFTARHAAWVGQNHDVGFDGEIARAWGNVENPLTGMNYLHGDPESCLVQLRSLYERKPFDDLISPITPPYDIDAVRRSITLFAKEVMEPFKRETRDGVILKDVG
ncbi:MAG: hypothetical protein JWN99_1234 [Ilumatobacteraceae bacterium]|nr:hypothetical protein [Ilumatobacteraceae bacterium]